MSVNLLRSEMNAGGAYGVSGSVTLRFQTDLVTPGKRTATIQCDPVNLEVDWGDGTVERLRGTVFTHEYEVAGTYDVKVGTIGASRFTPRYGPDGVAGLEGCGELVGLLDGATWRASSNMNGAFKNTSLSLIDSSCQQVFNKVATGRWMFRGATRLVELYDGFNMPLCTDSRDMFRNTGLTAWPASGTFESAGFNAGMFSSAELASFPDILLFPAVGASGVQGSWYETWLNCPFVQGGFPDNFRVPSDTTVIKDWGHGALWTTPPAIQWPSNVFSLNGCFRASPNLVAIPKESLDFRLAAAVGRQVNLSFNFARDCPQLTSVDFSWMPTAGDFRVDTMSASVTTWIMPVEPMPYILTGNFSTAFARLDVSSTAAVLSKLVEHITVFGAGTPNTRTASLVAGSFLNGPAADGPYAGLLDLPLRVTPGTENQPIAGCAAIQDWTPQMIADKDALVAAGIRVAYRDPVNGL